MSFDAHFDGKVFVPDEPVDLPVGHKVRVVIEPVAQNHDSSLNELLIKLQQLPENPDWPVDGAAQHDHYLYGTPKKFP
jgi:predicted DNA-binding antitoxin AbrB/MazE fold protein